MSEQQRRTSSRTTWIAAGALILAGAVGVGASMAAGDDPKPCQAQKFHFKAVEAACKKGGEPEVKKLMKKAMAKAKAAGEKMTCKAPCHTDTKTWGLTPEAVKSLEPWI